MLTGDADLNRHHTLMQIQTDATCPLCQEDEETVLHLMGECTVHALSIKCQNIIVSLHLSYEKLGNVHWQVLLRLAKASQLFKPIWGCGVVHWAHRRPQH